MKIFDIGCGKNKYKSKNKEDKVIGLDKVKLPGVDVVHNLEKFPWPFKANEFDVIICSHVLEHLDDLSKVMKEIWRVCKDEAKIKIWSPYFSNYGAYTDITHKHFFTSESFDYFDPSKNFAKKYSSEKIPRFKIVQKKLLFGRPFNLFSNLFNRHLSFYEHFLAYLFPARQIYFELIALKKEKK